MLEGEMRALRLDVTPQRSTGNVHTASCAVTRSGFVCHPCARR